MFWVGFGVGIVVGAAVGAAVIAWCTAAKDNKDDFVDFHKYLMESYNIKSTEEDVADGE